MCVLTDMREAVEDSFSEALLDACEMPSAHVVGDACPLCGCFLDNMDIASGFCLNCGQKVSR